MSAPEASHVAADVLSALDRLQLQYLAALDSKNMAAWLDTFAMEQTASYVCTTAENIRAGHQIAFILDDCHARLQDRVTFVTKIWAGTFQDYQTRHFTQRIACKQLGASEYEVNSHFNIAFTPSDTKRTDFHIAGIYIDRIVIADGEARFRSKQAITDNSVLPRYLVYPL